jgi:hypothetical protein
VLINECGARKGETESGITEEVTITVTLEEFPRNETKSLSVLTAPFAIAS